MISEVRRLIREGKSSELVSKYVNLPDNFGRLYFFCNKENVLRVCPRAYQCGSVRCNLCTIVDEALVDRCSTTLSLALSERHTSLVCEYYRTVSLTKVLAVFIAGGYTSNTNGGEFEKCVSVLLNHGANPIGNVNVMPLPYGSEEFMSTTPTPLSIAICLKLNVDYIIDFCTKTGLRSYLVSCSGPSLMANALIARQTRTFMKLISVGCVMSIYMRFSIVKLARVYSVIHQDHLDMLDIAMYTGGNVEQCASMGFEDGVISRKIELIMTHLKTFHQRVTLRRMSFIQLNSLKTQIK